jgi:hypothetical protein
VLIIPLQKASSIADVVTQAYGLKSTDALAGAAATALTNANPQLSGNIGALAPNTPIIVPTLPGATVTTTNVVDTQGKALNGLLARLELSTQQALTTPPALPGKTADPITVNGLKALQAGLAGIITTVKLPG